MYRTVPCFTWTNRTYVCIAACALELGGVIDDRYSMMPSSAHPQLRVHIHYNIDDGSAFIFLGWIYETGAVLDKQTVSLHCCVSLNLNMLLLAFGLVCYEVVISPSCVVKIHYVIMAITALHWSSLVECMERCRVDPGFIARTLHYCVCAYIRLYYQWSIQYEVPISPSFVILLSNGDGGSALISVCWMYGTQRVSCCP